MIHETEDIEQERDRLSHTPSPEDVPPVLCVFDLRTTCPVEEFSLRVRSVLGPALRLAVTQSFEGEDLPAGEIPDWFAAVLTTYAVGQPAVRDVPVIGQEVRDTASPQSLVSWVPRHTFSSPVVVGR
ncbi:hypothetical protein ABZ016_21235 [Streptomyces sp. NPDC006372]|uniref:hypothetical protein n=1 Tax=Streptomyces sp. NPDC006372 TaxID=3155599 RepID=UPI0033B7BF3E